MKVKMETVKEVAAADVKAADIKPAGEEPTKQQQLAGMVESAGVKQLYCSLKECVIEYMTAGTPRDMKVIAYENMCKLSDHEKLYNIVAQPIPPMSATSIGVTKGTKGTNTHAKTKTGL